MQLELLLSERAARLGAFEEAGESVVHSIPFTPRRSIICDCLIIEYPVHIPHCYV